MDSEIQAKIIILGSANVGKSCILHRYQTGLYSEIQKNTVGAQLLTKHIQYKDKHIKLNIWDTAGQERYQSFSKMYCRDAKAAILVYDISDPDSFEGMKSWHTVVSEDSLPLSTFIFVAGNKCDMAENSAGFQEQVKDYCESINAEHFLVSAKSGNGVEQLFNRIIDKISMIRNPKKNSMILDKNKLIDSTAGKKTKKKCC